MSGVRKGVRENNSCWHDNGGVWPGFGLCRVGGGVLRCAVGSGSGGNRNKLLRYCGCISGFGEHLGWYMRCCCMWKCGVWCVSGW